MVKPIGYYGASYDNPLIRDVAEHFNELQSMSEIDQMWLLGRLGAHYWMKWGDGAPSAGAEELRDRLEELPKHQLGWLITAVANKGCKPLGYWSLDYDIPLIMDIHNHFGDSLRSMSETDQAWLLGMMGDFYYQIHIEEDVSESEAADEVRDRMNELDRLNCGALIQALASK